MSVEEMLGVAFGKPFTDYQLLEEKYFILCMEARNKTKDLFYYDVDYEKDIPPSLLRELEQFNMYRAIQEMIVQGGGKL